jgi:hypothetical protein
MYGRAVTKAAGAIEGRYSDCMHLIDCLCLALDYFLKNSPSHASTTCSVLFSLLNPSIHQRAIMYNESFDLLHSSLSVVHVLSEGALATTYENLNHRLSYTDPIGRIHGHMHVPNIVWPRHAPKLDSIPVLWIIPPGDL